MQKALKRLFTLTVMSNENQTQSGKSESTFGRKKEKTDI